MIFRISSLVGELYLAYLLLGADDFKEDKQFFNLLRVKICLELLEALVERGGKRERARKLARTTLEQTKFAFSVALTFCHQ